MMQKKLILLFTTLLSIVLLSACGKCSNSQNTITKLDLLMSAPSEYPAGVAETMPVVVTNVGTAALNNIDYSIVNNFSSTKTLKDLTTNSDVSITPSSAQNCATLAVGQSCTLSVLITANSSTGSFTVEASILKPKVASTGITIGLTQIPVNNQVGINGVSMYYDSVVSLPNNNAGVTIVTFVVTSANTGVFNTINLLDARGESLAYQVLTGNSGNGLTALKQGDIVSLAVEIPSGATQLSFYPELEMNGVALTDGTAATPTIITVLRPNSPAEGVLSIEPSYFSLNESNTSQAMVVSNIGNGVASDIVINIPAPMTLNTANSTCSAILKAGSTCVIVVDFAAATSNRAGTNAVVVNYNTGLGSSSATATFTYDGTLAVAHLDISSGSNPNFNFNTTTANPSTSSIVTITNNGVTAIESFNYVLPTYFTTSTSSVANPCTAGIALQPNQSCNMSWIYTNSVATPTTTQNVDVTYTYLDPATQILTNGSSTVGVTYSTLQSQAILSVNPSSFSFGNILNNNYESNIQVFTVSNNGAIATANTPTASIATSDGIYTIIANTCNSALNAGATCDITVSAGPIASSIAGGPESNILNISYQAYPSAANNTLGTNLSTQVVTAQSANLQVSQPVTTGIAGGSGTSSSPYQLQSGTVATVTYTVTNIGPAAADNFNLSYTGTLSPWVASGPCTTQQILAANGGYCTITFTATGSDSAIPLSVGNITMNWTDQDFPSGQTQVFAASQLYVSVYAPASIAFNTSSVSLVAGGNNSIVTATLSGGYNVTAQTISIINNYVGAINQITSMPSPCTLSNSVTSCSFYISASVTAPTGSYSFGVSNSGTITLPISSISATVTPSTWVYVGYGAGAVTSDSITYPSLAFNESTNQPYLAYSDSSWSGRAGVMMYNGSSWYSVGGIVFTPGAANYVSLAFNESNQPYVAYQDGANNNKASVMMYNGSSWANVGVAGFSESVAAYVSLAFNESTNQMYVAYQDAAYNDKVTVMKYAGSSWVPVGTAGFSIGQANYVSLAFNESNQPYVAYQDVASSNKLTVMAYDGTRWNTVGSAAFSAGVAYSASLAFNPSNNQPYVAYTDGTNGSKASVMAYDGNNWNAVGSLGFTTGGVGSLVLAFDVATSQPYVAYQDGANGNKASVMAYNGSNWGSVGSLGFSAGFVSSISLAFNPNTNQPYVAYPDASVSYRPSVMRYPQ